MTGCMIPTMYMVDRDGEGVGEARPSVQRVQLPHSTGAVLVSGVEPTPRGRGVFVHKESSTRQIFFFFGR